MKNLIGIVLGIAFINNIIWLIDKWHYLGWLEKAGNIIGIFCATIGCFIVNNSFFLISDIMIPSIY